MAETLFLKAPSPWLGDLAPIDDGLVAKVGFATPDGGGERMWVHVLEANEDGLLRGVLLNSPVEVEGIACGDAVAGFGVQHIYEANVDPDVQRHSQTAQATHN